MSHSDSESDQAGVPLIEDFSGLDALAPKTSTHPSKRKRDDVDDDTQAPIESKRSKKKKKQTKKPRDVSDEALDIDNGVNHAIRHMDPSLLADHIAQRTKRFQPDLSLVEAEDIRIPERAITDTTSFPKDRKTDEFPAFLEAFAGEQRNSKRGKKGQPGGLANASKDPGSPHTLVVAGAGLRAADLTRALRKFQTKDSMVAKLFAKHIKLKEAVEMVKKTRMGIGVGTPQRIEDLLEDGCLKADRLERIVVDASHIDQKKRGILDMKETQVPLVKLLAREDLKEMYASGAKEGKGRIELLFF
ncbi:U3-containing 90S pre-ribosomal complex subunit [Teratosphaeria destructans]|uniref:U3-containing 90S pre-ribosomal complex subunit n=1 Tax=Teratosphaeria destructans TaxID=418781 RepID=A0A9W7SVA0_9PEZI|nr:U3-containing 90S pre-ribosomal complex subunit [Teratosphaeria destructans]